MHAVDGHLQTLGNCLFRALEGKLHIESMARIVMRDHEQLRVARRIAAGRAGHRHAELLQGRHAQMVVVYQEGWGGVRAGEKRREHVQERVSCLVARHVNVSQRRTARAGSSDDVC